MFASQQGTGSTSLISYLLINPSHQYYYVWYMGNKGCPDTNGQVNVPFTNSSMYAVRPTIHLKSEITISGGTGLPNDPYTVS